MAAARGCASGPRRRRPGAHCAPRFAALALAAAWGCACLARRGSSGFVAGAAAPRTPRPATRPRTFRRFYGDPKYDQEWKNDPTDPRWDKEKREFEWFFTTGQFKDRDLKLTDLPRPGGEALKDFWNTMYEKGVLFALLQSVFTIVAFAAIFEYLPILINGFLRAVFKIPIPDAAA
ncbi:unnamed protein product [Prorocentrum cordatum]|uniref:Uncharacterized protein n=1 Tax=Prorocentrum cordatum TaxID=2364126 RepID=A0ABN9WH75_9DINO|nr:unnamed protein product [Polarella glacialis]